MPTDEQVQARKRSEELLREKRLPVNENLPHIESVEELRPPTAQQVATRCFVLSHVIGLHYDVPTAKLRKALEEHGLWDHASPREKNLLSRDDPGEQAKADAAWLAEVVQVLAWGIGLVELDHWRPCDADLANNFPPNIDPTDKIAQARLRPFADIYNECDFLYRLHWAAEELGKKAKKRGCNRDRIMERHRAVNWLAGVEPEWDEVTTDT